MEKYVKKSSILILSLWVLAFLSILAIFSAPAVRQKIHIASHIQMRGELYRIAYSGIQKAMAVVSYYAENDTAPDVTFLNEPWAESISDFKDVAVGAGSFAVSYNRINNLTGRQAEHYGIIDEESKININKAPYEVLKRLFKDTAGLDDDYSGVLASAVIDWRDEDDKLQGQNTQVNEGLSYLNAGYSYRPKNSQFKTVEEILLVKGIEPFVFFKIRDCITVFGAGKININTASVPVLQNLGFTQRLTEKIASYRAGYDMDEITADDRYFSSQGSIVEDLSEYIDLTKAEKQAITEAVSQNLIGVKSDFFTAISFSKLEKKALYGKIRCVFSKSGAIKDWAFKWSSEPDA